MAPQGLEVLAPHPWGETPAAASSDGLGHHGEPAEPEEIEKDLDLKTHAIEPRRGPRQVCRLDWLGLPAHHHTAKDNCMRQYICHMQSGVSTV